MTAKNTITLHHQSSLLEIIFSDGFNEVLSLEMLRVNSPAIPSLTHDTDIPLLVTNKAFITIETMEHIEAKGIKILFNDGHDSGLFSWSYLYSLAENQDQLWLNYLKRLKKAERLKSQPLSLTVDYLSPCC